MCIRIGYAHPGTRRWARTAIFGLAELLDLSSPSRGRSWPVHVMKSALRVSDVLYGLIEASSSLPVEYGDLTTAVIAFCDSKNSQLDEIT